MASSDRKQHWKEWLPQLLAWLIAALIAYGRMDTRVSLLEAAKSDHDRRITILENGMQRGLDAILDEIKTLKRTP
jgi:hypothetical protein